MVDRNLNFYVRGAQFSTREGMLVEVQPSGFDWQAVVGAIPNVIDPFSENTAQQFPLGTKLVYGDQTFRYARNGAVALAVAELQQAVVPLAGHINEAINAPAVGVTAIDFTPNTVTTDDLAENELQDGRIHIYTDTGEGHAYRILSHPAIVGGVSGTLTLVDPIRVAPAAAATATVTHNKFFGTIVQPGPPTAMVLGFSQQVVTLSFYYWLLTAGPTPMLIDGSPTLGQHVRPSNDDAGAVTLFDTGEAVFAGPIGQISQVGADATGGKESYGLGEAQLE